MIASHNQTTVRSSPPWLADFYVIRSCVIMLHFVAVTRCCTWLVHYFTTVSTVHISNDLKWGQHVNVIFSKAASRLHFLKQLKQAGAGTDNLLYFYNMIVRPVLEYASPVWHSSLTVAQSNSLESVQKRAMQIIFPNYLITVHR